MKEFRRVLVAGLFASEEESFENVEEAEVYSPNIQLHFPVYFFCKCIIANEIHPCGQEELIQCSKQMRALTATSEFNFVDNKEELDRVCP